jgi:hypothetical protein
LYSNSITIMRFGKAIMDFNRAAVWAEAWDNARGRRPKALSQAEAQTKALLKSIIARQETHYYYSSSSNVLDGKE